MIKKILDRKKGFSLIEVMLLLLVLSLITAASLPLITRQHLKVPKQAVQGRFMCFWDNDQLRQQTYRKGRLMTDEYVSSCVFTPPDNVGFFFIQAVGGGGGGGGAGYSYFSSNYQSAYIGLFNTQTINNNSYLSADEFYETLKNNTITVCARGTRGGRGGDYVYDAFTEPPGACYVYEGTSYCFDGATNSEALEVCNLKKEEALVPSTVSCEITIEAIKYYGKAGQIRPSCTISQNIVPNLTYAVTTGSPGYPGAGYNSQKIANYDRHPNDGLVPGTGTDSTTSTAEIKIDNNRVKYCETGIGTGGTPAQLVESYKAVRGAYNDYDENAACRDYYGTYRDYKLSGNYGSGGIDYNGQQYYYYHIYYTKNLYTGARGEGGEYKTLFVRSFKDPVQVTVGKGGDAGRNYYSYCYNSETGSSYNSCYPGTNGGDTSFGTILTARGGKGGLLYDLITNHQKYKCADLNTCYRSECRPADFGSASSPRGDCRVIPYTETYRRQEAKEGGFSEYTNNNISSFYKMEIPMSDPDGPTVFGKGGKGAGMIDKCNVLNYSRQIGGVYIENFTINSVSCSSAKYEFINDPMPGKTGALIVTW